MKNKTPVKVEKIKKKKILLINPNDTIDEIIPETIVEIIPEKVPVPIIKKNKLHPAKILKTPMKIKIGKIKRTSNTPNYIITTTDKIVANLKDKVPVDDFKTQLDLRKGKILKFNSLETGEELIPDQLLEKDNEKDELKLLKYQLEKNDGNVNKFLLSKYSDGEFQKGVYDGYDNSLSRLNAGLEYDYHIYFPIRLNESGEDYYKDKRPNYFMIKTKELVDLKTNDSYIYHFPVHNYDEFNFATDFTDELISIGDNKSNGLYAALNILANNINNDNPNLSDSVFTILKSNDFIDSNNKLNLAIKNVMVEKYFKAIKSEKKKSSLEYLNQTMVGDKIVIPDSLENSDELKTNATPGKRSYIMKLNTLIPNIYLIQDMNGTYSIDDKSYDITTNNKKKSNIIKGFNTNESLIKVLKNSGYSIVSFSEKITSNKLTKSVIILLENNTNTSDKFAVQFTFTSGTNGINFQEIEKRMDDAHTNQMNSLSKGVISNPDNISSLLEYIKVKGLNNVILHGKLMGRGSFTRKVL